MVKYIARMLNWSQSNNERFVYQYRVFLHDGDSICAREWLTDHLEDLFLSPDFLLVDFRPTGQRSWRGCFRRADIPDDEYPVSIEEYEEEYPLKHDREKYVMAAKIQYVPEDYGAEYFDAKAYFFASSFDEAVHKARRTYHVELDRNEGVLCSDTLKIKKVGKREKWHLIAKNIENPR